MKDFLIASLILAVLRIITDLLPLVTGITITPTLWQRSVGLVCGIAWLSWIVWLLAKGV